MQVFTPLILKRRTLVLRAFTVSIAVFCLVVLLAQVAFARNTYVITDGDQVKVHTTFASDPVKVLSEAGVLLDETDTYTTQTVGNGTEITVRRGQLITVHCGGTAYPFCSYGETVGTLLDRLGIPSGSNFEASLPLNAQTYDGMEFTVNYVVRTEETYTVDIPFETVYREDPTLPEGAQEVLEEGKAGQMLCKTSVVYVDTQETQRDLLKETVLQEPVTQVIAVGTGESALAVATGVPIIKDGIIITATGEVLTYDKVMQFVSTAYTDDNTCCTDTTATGTKVRVGTVAVDPKVIPYGTRMFIVSNDGEYIYGIGTAEDCGGGIVGNRLDLYFVTKPECFQFGIRDCTVYFLV